MGSLKTPDLVWNEMWWNLHHMMTRARSKERERGFWLDMETCGLSEAHPLATPNKSRSRWERPLLIEVGRGQPGQIALRDSKMDYMTD